MTLKVRVINGLDRILKIQENYMKLISKHLNELKEKGYYLKPLHIVVVKKKNNVKKYYYHSRYWWKITYAGKKNNTSKIKWKYIGKKPPFDLFNKLPKNPLEGLKYEVKKNDIILEYEIYCKFKDIFKGLNVKILKE